MKNKERRAAGRGRGAGGHLPSRGLVRPLLLQSNWTGGSASCWRSKRGHQIDIGELEGSDEPQTGSLTWTVSDGQEAFSAAAGGAWAMEAIISAAEMGFTGSLVGSSIP